MKSRITDWLIRIRASYWFIPSLMAFGAVAAATAAVFIDARYGGEWRSQFRWLHANEPEGARAILTTVAGSMITVAGVTFSMTLLAVSHASSQIGPRLLAGFMRDRGNQFTLGTFIATFLYCLMVLRSINAGGTADGASVVFVPQLAILLANALAVLSVMVLIYFIHHVPQSINVSHVVARVGDELIDAIRCTYPEPGKTSANIRPQYAVSDAAQRDGACATLTVSGAGGYLRVLDIAGLIDVAEKHDVQIELLRRPGDFAISGQPLLRVWPAGDCSEELGNNLPELFSWGTDRTQQQDVMFPAEQLLEVLAKAMSPGVNGQYTALLCLNQLERGFAEILQRAPAGNNFCDDGGRTRLIVHTLSHEEFVAAILRPVRQFVRGDWVVTDHLMEMLGRLAQMPGLAGARTLLERETLLLRGDIEASGMVTAEKNSLLETAY